ncbi:flagellin domain protein [Arcobacter nitrofigilis DSM 7299]|uniref:Flagellin n=2 Tax=Arcobacter nitrofigilis TaxID=28199 RepID=D5V7E9_ARCNC|nr:flagellin [Arcobacter nitrofigilis]ABV02452.1 flagellin B [Arcobacter nitrofigilis DSM 7299]ADG94569.1 flagellin domain protein [Arcobacter nitrofigilis DSM 7299]
MRINTNVASLNAQEAAKNTNNKISSSLEKLSTGLKINKASDDASGLAIADKLRTQANSIGQGIDNGNSAVSLIQIADKSMSEQSNILDTVKAKLIQANTDTTSADGREAIRKDINKLLEQLDNIAKQTNYNGTTLLQSGYDNVRGSDQLRFQIGENKDDIIQSASIQSNTVGLGGGTERILQDTTGSKGNTISAETSIRVTADGTNALKLESFATGGSVGKVSISGITGDITFKGEATLSELDSNTQLILDKLSAASGKSVEVKDENGNILGTFSASSTTGVTKVAATVVNGVVTKEATYTISSGTTIKFGGQTTDTANTASSALATYSIESMKIEQSTASGNVTFSANAANLSIYNEEKGSSKELKITDGVKDTNTDATKGMRGGLTLSALKSLQAGQLTKEQTDKFQGVVDAAITQLNTFRADLGSSQNQIESGVRNLMTQQTNVKAAESIIRDVDYAQESANFNKQNIISQAGSYAMSQANSIQQNVLRLLQ